MATPGPCLHCHEGPDGEGVTLCPFHAAAPETAAERDRLQAELGLAKRLVNRLPLCPDHRDKEQPNSCVRCECERLLGSLKMVLPLAEAYLAGAPSSPDNAKLETARAAIAAARRETT